MVIFLRMLLLKKTYRVVETGRHSIKAKGETIVNGRPIKDEIIINRSNYYNFIIK